MVYAAVRHVLGTLVAELPSAAGYFRVIDITAPLGTFVNPRPPAAVAARGLGCVRIHQAVLGAFAQMLPELIYACSGGAELGVSASGQTATGASESQWVYLEFINESAVGGFADRDGEDGQMAGAVNGALTPVELIEMEYPILVEEFSMIRDSEGAGKHRGGLGLVRRYRFLADCSVQMRADRTRHAPFGLFGGHSSVPTGMWVESDGDLRPVGGKWLMDFKAGDGLIVELPGAGGYGDPLERDPVAVLADVVEDKVSRARARNIYGVVIEGQAIDWAATRQLRVGLEASPTEESRS
jgi:N-methylhydantoinase B